MTPIRKAVNRPAYGWPPIIVQIVLLAVISPLIAPGLHFLAGGCARCPPSTIASLLSLSRRPILFVIGPVLSLSSLAWSAGRPRGLVRAGCRLPPAPEVRDGSTGGLGNLSRFHAPRRDCGSTQKGPFRFDNRPSIGASFAGRRRAGRLLWCHICQQRLMDQPQMPGVLIYYSFYGHLSQQKASRGADDTRKSIKHSRTGDTKLG